MQPQGGSSGAPPQRGRGVPPRGSNLTANAPPYCPILRWVQEAVPLEQHLEYVLDQAKRGPAVAQLAHPQGGSSGAPPESGRGVPPPDSSLPVATVLPHSPIPGQVQEVPLAQLFNDARDEAKRTQALHDLVQPQGGSSGAPPQSGRGVPPRGSNLNANVPPYCPIPRRVPEAVPLEQLLTDVFDEAKRKPALVQLSHMQTSVPDFSLKVWHHPRMRDLILEEILRIYPYLNLEEEIPEDDSHRASRAITLLQPIAMDESVRGEFLRDKIPDYLYPFLKNPKESKGFNEVRIASLGVIGGLVQKSDIQAVEHLLKSEIVTLCIRCMKVHSCELTRAVAVFIFARILLTDIGQASIYDDQEQYLVIVRLLASMFKHPHMTPSKTLLKWVIFCYYLFSFNPSVSKSLHKYLPDTFKDGTFRQLFRGDEGTLERAYQVIWKAYQDD